MRFGRVLCLGAMASLALLGGCADRQAGPSGITSQSEAAPGAPTAVRASVGEFLDRVHVTWQAAPGAAWYTVQRSPSASGPFEATAMTKSTSWDDTAAEPGQSYYYRVTAGRSPATGAPQSSPSHSALGYAGRHAPAEAATVSSPSGVRASEGTFPDRIRVSWNGVADASWYSIYRSGSATGPFANIAGTRGTTWDDMNVTAGTSYYYRVAASRSPASDAAESAQSESVSGQATLPSAAKPSGRLAPPSGLLASDGTLRNAIHVTWDAVPGASWYNVYRATTASGPFKKVAATRATSWDDTSIEAGPLYYYALTSATSPADNAPESAKSTPETGYADWR